jgi:hypothetical protein
MGMDIAPPWTSARTASNSEKVAIKKQKIKALVAAELLLLERSRLL